MGRDRWSASQPCPVCGGHSSLPAGRGVRCAGFQDRDYAYCTREQFAGSAPYRQDLQPPAWRHWLGAGDCRCGTRHGAAESGAALAKDTRKKLRERHWDIRHLDGSLFATHSRIDYADGTRKIWWPKGTRPKEAPLYRSETLAGLSNDDVVIVTEGEPDCDSLVEHGFAAVGTVCGAESQPSDTALAPLLALQLVALWPDADDASTTPPFVGQRHMDGIANRLYARGLRPLLIDWRDAPPKGGARDYFERHSAEDFRSLLAQASPYPHEGFAPQRDASAARGRAGCTPLPSGADILDSVHCLLGRFVAYPGEAEHIAHVLWIAHTHLMTLWESTPRIAFLSPEPSSGKTRALEVTALLVPNPVEAVNVTPAYLFRKVGDSARLPTILYDEIDTVFGPKARDNEEIRALLNAGHRRGAVAGRCVVKGKTVETEEISAFSAVALAGIGSLPDTILSRSLIIRMRRRSRSERVEPFRRRIYEAEGHALRDDMAQWAANVATELPNRFASIPDGIEDRDADIWEPLLTVAEAAGGDWPARAHAAAVALVAASKETTPSLGVHLLRDVRKAFDRVGTDRLATAHLLKILVAMDDSPWADLIKGDPRRPIDARSLARMLKPYAVTSRNVRLPDGAQSKGFERADFADAWSRYCPPEASQPSQPSRREPSDSPSATAGTVTAALGTEPDKDGIESPSHLPNALTVDGTHGTPGTLTSNDEEAAEPRERLRL